MEHNQLARLCKYGYLKIDNFLPLAMANQIRRKILHNNRLFANKLLAAPDKPYAHLKMRSAKLNNPKRQSTNAQKGSSRNQFSYLFYRSSNKLTVKPQLNEIISPVIAALKTQICPELNHNGDCRDVFYAKFIQGHFISKHSDGKAGQYAFIYQLSKGWQVKFGGRLILYPRRFNFYQKKILPQFNSLTLLKLDHPMFHSVEKLTNPPHKHRITVSGWLE